MTPIFVLSSSPETLTVKLAPKESSSHQVHDENHLVGRQNTLLVCPPKLSQMKHNLESVGDKSGHGQHATGANLDKFTLEFKNQYGKRVLHIDDKAKLSYMFGSNQQQIKLEGTASDATADS